MHLSYMAFFSLCIFVASSRSLRSKHTLGSMIHDSLQFFLNAIMSAYLVVPWVFTSYALKRSVSRCFTLW
uniref:Secreted protein n=1 Tax=Panstrongylus lignarius TaxID=156445 RepID=A0A224XUH7_9HEMI